MKKIENTSINHFNIDIENGLSLEEVQKRIIEYGYNEVPEKKVSSINRFFKKFWGITPWMLEITAILEWIVGKYLESYIIVILLFFNAIVSFIQEEKANSAIDLLKQKLKINARVKRNGKWMIIPARELVPGDIIRLRAGDFIPADIKIIEGSVEVDQSALTGESLIIEKKIDDILFSGSIIKSGEITGIVISTGIKTYFGRTIELVQIARPKLHIEKTISEVVKWLIIMVSVMLSIGLALSILRGIDLIEIIPLLTILLVSTIPVALPTMFTISMALGSLELSKKGALVTRLDAIEDAAMMDVVCVDKTGTLTMNKLSIADVLALNGYKKEDVILYGALASQEANQDPIDLAILSAAKDMKISLNDYIQKKFIPFDPSTKRTEAIIEKGKQEFFVFKGAVKSILSLCKSDQIDLKKISEYFENLSVKGYRVIAIAKGSNIDTIELIGMVALYDKPRIDSLKLINELKDLGISLKMLTGDALPIAKEVATQLGLGENIAIASDLKRSLKENENLHIIEKSNGFAEIYPEDKYLIVKSLQKIGHIVGMTGDGINDAPALKQAEVGIAVSNATDVAKKSSSVVLTIEGLEGIVELIKIGRKTYQRIITWIINKIIKTFEIVIFIVLAFILTGKYVVSTFQMILLLFLSDYVTLSISTDNVRYSSKPERWNIIELIKLGIFYGTLIVLESMLILYIGISYFGLYNDINRLRTFIFDWLTLSGYFTVLVVRERKHFWRSKPSKLLTLSIIINSIIVLLISIFGIPGLTPITIIEFSFIFIYTFITCLLMNDYIKVLLMKKFKIFS